RVMASLTRELVLLMHQFLDEEKYKRTLHMLEMESGYYFNMRYFEEVVTNGEWEEVVKYLQGFTKVEDNRYSMKIFFEIQKQKFLEALDRNDHPKACEMLRKDLKVFSGTNQELYKEITLLLGLENFRENEQLSKYADAKTARSIMLGELKKLIEANPVFRDKLTYPSFKSQRLRTLINQSLNWQHQLCKNQKPNPDIRTLLVDHSCGQSQSQPQPQPQPNVARAPSPVTNPFLSVVPKLQPGFPHLGAHGLFQAAPAPLPPNLAGWMTNPLVHHPSASAGPIGFGPLNDASMLKRGRTPPTNTPALEYRTADEHAFKRTRAFGISDEVNHQPVNVLPVGYSGQSRGQSSYSSDDLPKAVVMTLDLMSSSVSSMDFHPIHQVLLLVGTNNGQIMIWDLCSSREKLVQKNFKASKIGSYSMPLQTTLANDYTASINRVTWSPDGKLFGVAYSKSLVQIYSYHGGDDIRNHLEIEAHAGSVNDLAFAYPNKILSIVTCGDDKLIKVWDAVTGAIQNEFEGHEAPVYSVCPHFKENIQFVFSTAIDGKIKAFLYDNVGPRVNFDAPGQSSTRLAYSADGTRLFSCGTNKQGDSFIVEWNEAEGTVKRTYNGLGKQAIGVVQFDTTKDRFIAAGDEGLVKFWDMDNSNLLTTVDSEGGLLTSPIVRFNKDGILLAVSIHANGIKIIANPDGVRLLRTTENSSFDPSGAASTPVAKTSAMTTFGTASASGGPSTTDKTPSMPPMTLMNSDKRNLVDRPRIGDEAIDKSRMWKVTEISEPSQCLSLRLPDNTSSLMQVTNLVYTNSGVGVLALVANAVHKLWKWPKNDRNTSGKANARLLPQLWQPTSGILMTNSISDTNPEDSIACFTLSNNDSYVISASGGKISLFNMMTFKTMTTFMPPPPAATFLAFHPKDNNIVAIGMDDASIQIFSVRLDEVMANLKGHQKRITGLAFSNSLGVMVSSGADAILCVWNMNGYEKQTSKQLHIPGGRVAARSADTRVQFHQDQTHLLVVHETQIAIFEAPRLECLKQWGPREVSGPITNATYSCDSQSIFVTFEDGSIDILTASTLRLRCRISSSAYLPSNPTTRVYPLVVTAHPSEPNQFALGLTDGGVCVIEPLESEGKWGTSAGPESVAGPSTTTVASMSVRRSEVHDTVMDSKHSVTVSDYFPGTSKWCKTKGNERFGLKPGRAQQQQQRYPIPPEQGMGDVKCRQIIPLPFGKPAGKKSASSG
nr:topless-related protein 4-like isoform X1 [Tanacetum cinerariifolium]